MMKWDETISEVRRLPLLALLLTILISSLLLIALNFFTLKTMSSVRAYVNGESNYSKGEKNATNSLVAYLHSEDEKKWNEFLQYISIPQGDSLARVTLSGNGSREIVRRGFIEGNNHSDDIDDMIWLFKTFKNLPLMAKPINNWEKGDSLIYQKLLIGKEIHASIQNGNSEERKEEFLEALEKNNRALTEEEIKFSENLGEAARKIKEYLIYVNTIIILLIIGSVSLYAASLLRRLNAQNRALANANKELDLIAYSISHDLRAPINSMMGIVNLVQLENDPEKQKTYMAMLQRTLDKQEKFIKEVINLAKESRHLVKKKIVELGFLIEQVINTHQHMPAASNIQFITDIGVHRVFTDSSRLEIILNNLVSNAIKYHDHTKSEKMIWIRTYSKNNLIIVEVEDNGVGIDKEDHSKIYEMYYMSKDREKGTGLGLYIVKEAVNKLNGKIELKSKKGEGTTFSVILEK
ncbi:MAG TPA: two-component sensor histidine kinase [Cytophagales bacterium]|nr:two-component sensor histidine kinase [Cytophagales bacterium]